MRYKKTYFDNKKPPKSTISLLVTQSARGEKCIEFCDTVSRSQMQGQNIQPVKTTPCAERDVIKM